MQGQKVHKVLYRFSMTKIVCCFIVVVVVPACSQLTDPFCNKWLMKNVFLMSLFVCFVLLCFVFVLFLQHNRGGVCPDAQLRKIAI